MMFEKEIEIVKNNIDKTVNINMTSTSPIKASVVGYGVFDRKVVIEGEKPKSILKVLLLKHIQSGYRFPLNFVSKYTILSKIESINPDNFISVNFDCFKQSNDGKLISCY